MCYIASCIPHPFRIVLLFCLLPASPLCQKSVAANHCTIDLCALLFSVDSQPFHFLQVPHSWKIYRGGIPSDHNQPHLRAAARSPLLSSERFEISEINSCQDHVRAQHCCAPACPGVNPAPICFFPRITFHFLSLLLLSHVVDSAIIKGAH